MELLNTLAITNHRTLSLTSPLTTGFPTRTRPEKNPLRYYAHDSILHKNLPFSICLSHGRKFLVLAHISRTTSRRNSLRKKLIDEKQVRFPLNPNYDVQYIDRNFRDTESFREKTNRDTEKESNFRIGFADDNAAEESGGKEPKRKLLGESVMLTKLENWVQQYKKDTECWGIGSASIFTVFQNSNGNVKRVSVNEEEILRRARVEQQEAEDFKELNLKILHAKRLAIEMESGKNVIPRNSSVANFVIQSDESGFLKAIQGFQLQPEMLRELPKVGSMILCGFIALWALKKIFANANKEKRCTEPGKEMMRRKIKSRNDKEREENGVVEVVQDPIESPMVSAMKPKLDRKELMNRIKRANAVTAMLTLPDSSTSTASKSTELDEKIQEIREMARQDREIECREHRTEKRNGLDGEENQTRREEEEEEQRKEEPMFLTNLARNEDAQALSITNMEISAVRETPPVDLKAKDGVVCCADDAPLGESSDCRENYVQVAPSIIRSVKEAREYLSEKRYKQESHITPQVKVVSEADLLFDLQSVNQNDNRSHELNFETSGVSNRKSESPPLINGFGDSIIIDEEFIANKNHELKSCQGKQNDVKEQQFFSDQEVSGNEAEKGQLHAQKNWMEKNFGEFEPIIKKIGSGFKDNYMVAREKESGPRSLNSNMTELGSIGDDSELDWMEDDNLREIVLQVRENELAGREPFFMMDEEDKIAFFKGLEKKVERENEQLLELHEFLHSNIENLDYGTDGISIYDPPEKIIPRWKGPLLEKSPEFLDDFLQQRKAIFGGNVEISLAEKNGHKFLQNSMQSSTNENVATSSAANGPVKKLQGDSKKSKTVIEGSDGSIRAGKKSGKEFWQHTKKWSREFLECYNAETDPEVKSDMKDIGKDLDRWITEKEIKEAADFMEKMPERNKEFMEKKLKKLKREMELFGPQAVVSKYREYSEQKKEDYLWWLDLPHVLCIEMYTCNDEQQRIGFYSLEMAGDLEVEPKPVHVIAFENSNDCKNLCYIIQAHLEMLGSGHAFVVPRPPKDTFREAKANGFSVTVIRKGELQLNVDQTLEEVEEQIIEIGSKMYHDMIMHEQSVDASSIMKGIFGFDRKTLRRKRSKQMRKKTSKKLR